MAYTELALEAIQYNKILSLVQAFSDKDVNNASVMLFWLEKNGVDIPQFLKFHKQWTLVNRLMPYGYFFPRPNPAQSKMHRKLEAGIEDRELRRFVRAMRLQNTKFSSRKKDPGG